MSKAAIACCTLLVAGAVTAAAQELPPPKKKTPVVTTSTEPRKTAGAGQPVTELVVSADVDARISVDGEKEVSLRADEVKTMIVAPGDHLVTIVSADKLLRRHVTVKTPPGQRTIATFELTGDLDDARSEHEQSQQEKLEAEALQKRAKKFADLPWVRVPAASAAIGCAAADAQCLPDEKPPRSVSIAAFEIMPTELTVSQFQMFAKATTTAVPPQPGWSTRADMPAVNITWSIARDVCQWLGGRLPSAAEWEQAARAGGGTVYPWGDRFAGGAANVAGQVPGDDWLFAAPVGSFAPSGAGLYDMTGNVWEWTADEYGAAFREIRGGSFASTPTGARISTRGRLAPGAADESVGVRCVRTPR